jgi:hypothetical protein
MPRRNNNSRQLIIRFKDGKGNSLSTKVFSQNGKDARDHFSGGRVLRIGKYDPNQAHRVGEYNDIPEKLMREFSQDRRRSRQEESSLPITKPVLES